MPCLQDHDYDYHFQTWTVVFASKLDMIHLFESASTEKDTGNSTGILPLFRSTPDRTLRPMSRWSPWSSFLWQVAATHFSWSWNSGEGKIDWGTWRENHQVNIFIETKSDPDPVSFKVGILSLNLNMLEIWNDYYVRGK